MSFLWHGLTEQGAQVPVQVDAQGRVIAVDGTPGVSNWERTGTTLSPAVPGDSVDIGSGNISLNADGSIIAENFIRTNNQLAAANSSSSGGTPAANFLVSDGRTNDLGLVTYSDGTTRIGGTLTAGWSTDVPNIALNASGSASFAGNITAPNVTFRSADPQFYVKKSKNKDASPEYVGPELDLLAEIARLEALVRHLYETLRLAPPAGWPVWDGNDDVLRQLRK